MFRLVPFDKVRDWFAGHGCRDQVPRRDAINPDVLFHQFMKDGRNQFGVDGKTRPPAAGLENFTEQVNAGSPVPNPVGFGRKVPANVFAGSPT